MPQYFPNIQTKVITNTTFTTPQGLSELFMKNTGASNATFTGNVTGSDPVTLAKGESFSLGYLGTVRAPITINATGTIVEISMTLNVEL